MIPKDEVIRTLWNLIETNQVEGEGFSKAADVMSHRRARHFFLGHSLRCSQLAQELRNLAYFLGEAPGLIRAFPQSLWPRLRPAHLGENEHETVEGCLGSVAFAISRYRAALQKALPSSISTVIRMQYDQVLEVHEQLRHLKSEMAVEMAVPVGR